MTTPIPPRPTPPAHRNDLHRGSAARSPPSPRTPGSAPRGRGRTVYPAPVGNRGARPPPSVTILQRHDRIAQPLASARAHAPGHDAAPSRTRIPSARIDVTRHPLALDGHPGCHQRRAHECTRGPPPTPRRPTHAEPDAQHAPHHRRFSGAGSTTGPLRSTSPPTRAAPTRSRSRVPSAPPVRFSNHSRIPKTSGRTLNSGRTASRTGAPTGSPPPSDRCRTTSTSFRNSNAVPSANGGANTAVDHRAPKPIEPGPASLRRTSTRTGVSPTGSPFSDTCASGGAELTWTSCVRPRLREQFDDNATIMVTVSTRHRRRPVNVAIFLSPPLSRCTANPHRTSDTGRPRFRELPAVERLAV